MCFVVIVKMIHWSDVQSKSRKVRCNTRPPTYTFHCLTPGSSDIRWAWWDWFGQETRDMGFTEILWQRGEPVEYCPMAVEHWRVQIRKTWVTSHASSRGGREHGHSHSGIKLHKLSKKSVFTLSMYSVTFLSPAQTSHKIITTGLRS